MRRYRPTSRTTRGTWDPYAHDAVCDDEETPEEAAHREATARAYEAARVQRALELAERYNCPTCSGSGRINARYDWRLDTARNASGYVSDACPGCNGSGHVEHCKVCGAPGPTDVCGRCLTEAIAEGDTA